MTTTNSCRFLVMTTSGKPVFVHPTNNNNEDENDTTRLCGLVQALRVSIQQILDNQEIHCLQTTRSTRVVWMTIQSLTWMVIVPNDHTGTTVLPVAFWKAQLERMYLSMIMMFTLQIQNMLTKNPQLDVETLWRNKKPEQLFFPSVLDDPSQQPIVWGIPTCFLSSVSWRRELASSLVQASQGSANHPPEDILHPWMALLLARTNANQHKMITYVASASFPGFTTSDGALFWNWLQDQLENSSKQQQQQRQQSFPICFPHFHAEGYLYASLYSLSEPFTLVLLHQHEHTDAFPWAESFRAQTRHSSFWEEFRSNQLEEQWLWEEYLDLSQAWHFMFRMHHISTSFTQYIVSPEETNRNNSREELWRTYHQLCWQLRLGSTGVESTLNKVMTEELPSDKPQYANPTVASDCPMLQCMDAPPPIQGVTYVTQGQTTYLAMSGRDFEL